MEKQYEQFDNHIFVIFSIIIGLAITEFLEGIALIILNWGRVEFYWVHTFFVLLVFLYSLAIWWGLRKYRSNNWNFMVLLLFLGICSTVYLLNKMAFPDIQAGTSIISLKKYYYDIRVPFFFTYLIFTLLIYVRSIIILKRPYLEKQNLFYYVGIIAAIALAIYTEESLHSLITAAAIIGLGSWVGWGLARPKMKT